MATFNTSGIRPLIDEMTRLGQNVGPVAEQMCMAAAEEIRMAWRKSAYEHGLVDTGAMFDSITYPNQPTAIGGLLAIDVYPQGKDARGVRNAEKAFILHYGSSRIKPTYWVDAADVYSAQPVQQRLQAIWDQFLAENGAG